MIHTGKGEKEVRVNSFFSISRSRSLACFFTADLREEGKGRMGGPHDSFEWTTNERTSERPLLLSSSSSVCDSHRGSNELREEMHRGRLGARATKVNFVRQWLIVRFPSLGNHRQADQISAKACSYLGYVKDSMRVEGEDFC